MSTTISAPAFKGFQTGTASQGVSAMLRQFFAGVVQYLRQAEAKRRAVAHLKTLDSHLLADIGIDRTEIEFAVNGGK